MEGNRFTKIDRTFEAMRIEEELVACAYEHLVPPAKLADKTGQKRPE